MAFPLAKRVIVCGRIGDPYVVMTPGASLGECADCGVIIWQSAKTQEEYERLNTPTVCVECFARHRDEGHAVITTRQKP